MALRKIQKEIVAFQKMEDKSITAAPVSESDLFKWSGTITGPAGSPYEGGTFFLNITLGSDYPFKAPKVEFATKVFHPNVNENGGICLDALKNDEWSPSMGIVNVLQAIQCLLAAPTADSPLNTEAGHLLKTDLNAYNKKAKEWTQRYAV